jgi:hypothetical protein
MMIRRYTLLEIPPETLVFSYCRLVTTKLLSKPLTFTAKTAKAGHEMHKPPHFNHFAPL